MIPSFSSILVSVTEGCHVGCAHCGFIGSSRDRETDELELEDWVQQACEFGIPSIIFTGGEPFERYEVLRKGVLAAIERDVPSSVFTSSYWATSVHTAESMLSGLRGLRHLYLSTDAFHQRRVPYEYVHNVIAAADRLQIPEVTLCITYSTEVQRCEVRENYRTYGSRVRYYESRVIPTPFIGKALNGEDPGLAPVEENFKCSCWLKTPIINPNGDVCACHAGKVGAHGDIRKLPYWLGNLRESSFHTIMEAARYNAPYQYLRTHGPKGIARLYQHYPELQQKVGRDQFTGPCDLCFSTLSTLAGREALNDYCQQSETQNRIAVRLAVCHREAPVLFRGESEIPK
jgi:MoaA/NifB/PqqE/SkfB family radical SAM enzyme